MIVVEAHPTDITEKHYRRHQALGGLGGGLEAFSMAEWGILEKGKWAWKGLSSVRHSVRWEFSRSVAESHKEEMTAYHARHIVMGQSRMTRDKNLHFSFIKFVRQEARYTAMPWCAGEAHQPKDQKK